MHIYAVESLDKHPSQFCHLPSMPVSQKGELGNLLKENWFLILMYQHWTLGKGSSARWCSVTGPSSQGNGHSTKPA